MYGFPFVGFAHGNEERYRGQRVIVDDWPGRALGIEQAVMFEKIQKAGGSDALVAVDKGMVFNDEVEKHGGFFFDSRIEFLAVKALVSRVSWS